MRWEMEMYEIESVMETIWDLHDKISDAIHSISRSHFLDSIKTLTKKRRNQFDSMGGGGGGGDGDEKGGFVFMKDFRVDDDAAMAEARSLNAIRTALENLEDQLEFFHTVQSQQRAERDAALARLEQSRIILAMRLADHQGKKCKVIEEALAFVGDVRDASRFVSPENLFDMPRDQAGETLEEQKGKKLSTLMRMLVSSLSLAKDSLKMEKIGGVLGNAALFAVSMLAFLQLHQVALRAPRIGDQQRIEQRDGSAQTRHFDVFSARG